jgi:reactive chlorine resistance protein C
MGNHLEFSGAVSMLERIGTGISRYGLATILLLIGLAKFTPEEAAGIQPLVAHSPLMSWMYGVLSVRGVSDFIGCIELLIALLLALRPLWPRLSLAGSIGAIVTFVLTASFLLSTPGAIQFGNGISILGAAGQFLIKDLALLGVAVWTASEALSAIRTPSANRR